MHKFQHLDPARIHAAAESNDRTYPYASWEPIPENDTQPGIVPASFILHTMAGPRSTDPDSLRRYIERDDIGGECHLILGYTKLIQVIRFDVRADNNYRANSWFEGSTRYGAVSVETQDNGALSNVEDDLWNEYQVEHLAGIAAQLALLDDTEVTLDRVAGDWRDRGVDGHRAWPEWSIYTGKTCPGQARWEQIPRVLDLARQIEAWRPVIAPPIPTTPPEDIMRQIELGPFVMRLDGCAAVIYIHGAAARPVTQAEANTNTSLRAAVSYVQANPMPYHNETAKWLEAQGIDLARIG